MLDVILVEPRNQENLGAIARLIKNFEADSLVLINPKCKVGKKAHNMAKHAQSVLNKAKIVDEKVLKKYDFVIGTTAIIGRDYNLPRNPLSPKQCAEKIAGKKAKVAILIGREASGLTNEEIIQCDMLVTIPASKKYSTMNVSQATGVILYEIYQASKKPSTMSHIKFATKNENKIMFQFVNKIINKLEFTTTEKKETQQKVWKRFIGKAMLTRREAFAVIGLLRKILDSLNGNRR